MKRLGLTLVAAVCLTATTFAAGNQPTTAKWEGNINITKLRKKLYAGTCHILKSGYIFFGIAYISVSSIILIAWNA